MSESAHSLSPWQESMLGMTPEPEKPPPAAPYKAPVLNSAQLSDLEAKGIQLEKLFSKLPEESRDEFIDKFINNLEKESFPTKDKEIYERQLTFIISNPAEYGGLSHTFKKLLMPKYNGIKHLQMINTAIPILESLVPAGGAGAAASGGAGSGSQVGGKRRASRRHRRASRKHRRAHRRTRRSA
jgi:hypothetical protein